MRPGHHEGRRGIGVLAAGAIAAALLLILTARVREGAKPPSSKDAGHSLPALGGRAEDGLANVEPTTVREAALAAEAISSSASEGSAVSSEASAELEPQVELEKRMEEIRLAMESSLLGVLDAGVFLDAARIITELPVDSNTIPEADPFGALCYPVMGTPEGIRAELRVKRTSNPSFGNPVLALRFQLDAPGGPYLVEGALRQSPMVTISIRTDPTGATKYMTILTDFQPAPDGRDIGQSQGFIPLAALYSFDFETRSWTSKVSGSQDGSVQDQALPMTLIGKPCPQSGELEQFSSGLSLMYESLKPR